MESAFTTTTLAEGGHLDDWRGDAACKGRLVNLFYPEDDNRRAQAHLYGEARQICAGCKVREPCAEAGQAEKFGLWGGMSPTQRHPKQRRGVVTLAG
jgi:hypothetical protein